MSSGIRYALTAMLALVAIPGWRAAPLRAQSALTAYQAKADRVVYAKPPLPAVGGAGSALTDPTFGSRMLRVTDPNTRPGTAAMPFPSAINTAWA